MADIAYDLSETVPARKRKRSYLSEMVLKRYLNSLWTLARVIEQTLYDQRGENIMLIVFGGILQPLFITKENKSPSSRTCRVFIFFFSGCFIDTEALVLMLCSRLGHIDIE